VQATVRSAVLGVVAEAVITATASCPPRVGVNSAPPEPATLNELRAIYDNPSLRSIARIADALYAYDNSLSNFRWYHYQLVQGIIGDSRGTAGTRGLDYLARSLRLRLFPEFTAIRADLVRT